MPNDPNVANLLRVARMLEELTEEFVFTGGLSSASWLRTRQRLRPDQLRMWTVSSKRRRALSMTRASEPLCERKASLNSLRREFRSARGLSRGFVSTSCRLPKRSLASQTNGTWVGSRTQSGSSSRTFDFRYSVHHTSWPRRLKRFAMLLYVRPCWSRCFQHVVDDGFAAINDSDDILKVVAGA